MATLLYICLKIYSTSALKFYFSKWEVYGTENIPQGPVIFVPNHQNAFLDAVLVTCSSNKKPWFMTRAKVFNKPTIAKLFNSLQMLPIYRFRDGFESLKKNELVMANIVEKLSSGESILVFAEGTFNERDNLGPLQKGVARMALSANEIISVPIVPVGLCYESRTRIRSRVLVNFGIPIYTKAMQPGVENRQERMEELLSELRKNLQPLMLHIPNENYSEVNAYLKNNRIRKENLLDQLGCDQSLVANYNGQVTASNTKPSQSVNIIMWYVKLNSVIPILITHKLILTNIKDPQFTGSVKFAAGMFLAPLFWFLQALLLWAVTGSGVAAVIYFITLPLFVKLSR